MKEMKKIIELLTTNNDNITSFFSTDSSGSKISSLQKALNELSLLENAKLENTQAYCMMIWSCIELLSRFYSGQLGNQQATKRLKLFLRAYFPHKREHTSTLLLFRNACMHSVSLHASDVSGKKEVRFTLTNEGELMNSEGRTLISVNTIQFKKNLIRAIEKYQSNLEKDEILRLKFEKVYRKLGFVVLN